MNIFKKFFAVIWVTLEYMFVLLLLFINWAFGRDASFECGDYGVAHNFREFGVLIGKIIKSKFCRTRF